MRLTELGAQWIRNVEDGRRRFVVAVDERTEANGIRFRCPTCTTLGTTVIAHVLTLWDRSVGAAVTPGPHRWDMTGAGFDDLTLDPEVRLHVGCGAAFRVTAGEVQPCS